MSSERNKIILVDDVQSNLDQGRGILRTFFEVYPALSAAQLFKTLEKIIPDLILLDITMPEMNGYEAIKILKADNRFKDIPVIFLTAKDDADSELEGFNLGAVDYVRKPFSASLLLKRIEKELIIVKQKKELQAAYAEIKDYADNLDNKVREKTAEVLDLQNAIITTVANLVELRDECTGGHISRTRLYMKALIDELIRQGIYKDEIKDWDMDFLLSSVQLHDVGKIAITDIILNKPGKLTNEEFIIMKNHVSVGVEAIEEIIKNTKEHEFLKYALRIAGTHHEKWDGSGYPNGLRGNSIPLEGRLMAVADVYDALISKRQYKEPFTHAKACQIIEEGAGMQFDPVLVDIFRNVETEFERIAHENE
jgi:putative two-component system response regulator